MDFIIKTKNNLNYFIFISSFGIGLTLLLNSVIYYDIYNLKKSIKKDKKDNYCQTIMNIHTSDNYCQTEHMTNNSNLSPSSKDLQEYCCLEDEHLSTK